MKQLVLIIGMGLSQFVFGQVGNVPSMKVLNDKINLGSINEDDGSVTEVFTFVNVGKKPLKILNVLTTCGCTTPEWTQTEVKSGDSGKVVAVFNPKNKDGWFSKSLTVLTNGEPQSVTLTVEGSVYSSSRDISAMFPGKRGNLLLSTTQLELPAQKEDKIDTVWLDVYNPTDEVMIIYNVVSPHMMRTEAKYVLLAPKSGDNIMLTYNGAMGKGLGQRIDSIYLVTNDKNMPDKLITIKANIVQNFDTLTPEQRANAPVVNLGATEADLGQLYQGEVGTYSFEISNTGKSDLVIRRVRSECDCISAKIPQTVIKKGGKGKIIVSLDTKRMHRNVEKTVTVITNDPKHSVSLLKIKAKVVIPGKEAVEY